MGGSKTSAGFSLLEMAIVIVVITLIAGGVVTGTNLLRSAQLRSIMVDKNRYTEAVETFRTRYRAFPGDISNATDYWGAENANPVTCAQLSTPSTSEATCNGDGNESIFENTSAGYKLHERFRMWQHLVSAELIEGSFTGVNACSSNTAACYAVGVNAPVSEIRSATWALYDLGAEATIPSYYYSGIDYRHVMYFGGQISNTYPFGRVLTAKETWTIDGKFDDGLPGKGKILSLEPVTVTTWSNLNDCATTTDPETAEYNVQDKSPQCMLLFLMPF